MKTHTKVKTPVNRLQRLLLNEKIVRLAFSPQCSHSKMEVEVAPQFRATISSKPTRFCVHIPAQLMMLSSTAAVLSVANARLS